MYIVLKYPHVWLLILSWLIADLAIPILIILAHKLGAYDNPHTYKSHARPIPFVGGLGIFIAFSITLLTTAHFNNQQEIKPFYGIIAGGAFIVILGLLDDIRPISAVIKLFVLFLATYILSKYDIRLTLAPVSWPNVLRDLVDVTLTLLWIVGIISAMNSLDNMDGASGGITAIASAATFLIAWTSWQTWVSYVAVALLGSCMGFLRYNFHPHGAKVFLGDNGSFFVGFVLAAMMVLGGWSGLERGPSASVQKHYDIIKSILVPVLILAVPMFDITLSTVLRYINGTVSTIKEAIVYCGRDHLSHRLVAMGFSKAKAVLVLYLVAILSGCIAFAVSGMRPEQYLLTAMFCISALVLFGIYLNKAPIEEANEHNTLK